MGRMVVVEDAQGRQNTIPEHTWNMLKSHGEPGDTRKGKKFIAFQENGETLPPAKPVQNKAVKAETFVPPVLQTKPPAKPAAQQPAQTEPSTEVTHPFKELEGFGTKSINVVRALGIETFEQLAKADPEVLKASLEEAGFAAKVALIPTWQAEAAKRAK